MLMRGKRLNNIYKRRAQRKEVLTSVTQFIYPVLALLAFIILCWSIGALILWTNK